MVEIEIKAAGPEFRSGCARKDADNFGFGEIVDGEFECDSVSGCEGCCLLGLITERERYHLFSIRQRCDEAVA